MHSPETKPPAAKDGIATSSPKVKCFTYIPREHDESDEWLSQALVHEGLVRAKRDVVTSRWAFQSISQEHVWDVAKIR